MFDFDAYFFDYDGTVGDTEPDIRGGWLAAIRHLGLPEKNFDKVFRVGPALHETAALLFPELSSEKRIELQNAYKYFYDEICSFENSFCYPGIIDAIRQLHNEGKKVYIVTNKRFKPLVKLMKKFDLFPFCSGIFVPDIHDPENHFSKNQLVAMALRVSGAAADRALMIGDTEIDIAAGKSAGIRTCAVTWGYGKRAVLQQAEPDFVIDSVEHLP